jgi:hypothetical protein
MNAKRQTKFKGDIPKASPGVLGGHGWFLNR